jgi:serine protease Do
VQQRHGMNRGWFVGCLMLCLVLGACGQQSNSATRASGGGGEVVSGREDIQSATVRIEAEGTFIDPQVGQQTVAGSGSGFIIDPSGIAVTNNHVVTGSALLRVYIGGKDEARNAKVLGVSECSDLAVIDIDGGGYPYFKWHNGEINTGLEVYAAGFPLGDPEFTLTRGIVSKAEADGDTEWASIDSVIEHDATINEGNSGGPLVDNNGKVVGVNYRGLSDTNQYYAISPEEALKIIPQLRNGQDVTSIGVNGKAVVSEDKTISGVWVSSVESGSPADEAGVRPGDIITRLEGLPLGADGTMSDYCDILRSRERSATMTIEVLRFETGEVLKGELNGRNLETSADFSTATSPPAESTGYTAEPTSATSSPSSETQLVQAVEDYYWAVDREDWSYTYEHLDSETKAEFTEEEWFQKNQYFADTEGLDLSSIDVQVNNSQTDPVVSVTVYRTFTDGTSIGRDTFFVFEDGEWKHRFGQEENKVYMPDASYEQFLNAQ